VIIKLHFEFIESSKEANKPFSHFLSNKICSVKYLNFCLKP